MLQAMNTGHEGSLSTAHANSPRDLLSRLETMALMSDVELPVGHVREQIATALDLIVHMTRLPEGTRIATRISAVEGLRGDSIVLQDVFVWRRGSNPGFQATGALPSVLRVLDERDEGVDPRIFGGLAEPPSPLASGQGPIPPAGAGGDSRLRARAGLKPRRAPDSRAGGPRWPGAVRRLGTILE
jgi:hypothetical protein